MNTEIGAQGKKGAGDISYGRGDGKTDRRFIDKPHAQHLDTLGLCYAAEGNFEKAAEYSREAVLEVCLVRSWRSMLRRANGYL